MPGIFRSGRTLLRVVLLLGLVASGLSVGASPAAASTAPGSGGSSSLATRADGAIGASISAGFQHACAVRTDGTLACWGSNDSGKATPPSGTFTVVSAGDQHNCAIRTDSTVACWGGNSAGQATPTGGTFVAVDGGGEHTCGIKTDATIACWGSNSDGQSTPPAGQFAVVSAGAFHTCAVSTAGELTCWGDTTDIAPPPGTFVTLGEGAQHGCGIRTDGTLSCWGVGDASVAPPGTFTSLSAGPFRNCAIKTNGETTCWGSPTGLGALPTGTYVAVSAGAPDCGVQSAGAIACGSGATPPSGTFVSVAVSPGDDHTCAIRNDGELACWGSPYPDGKAFPPAGTFTTVSAAGSRTCAIRTNGTVACWGGEGAPAPPAGTFTELSAGAGYICGIRTEGTLTCWGALPSGATPPSGTFVEVSAGSTRGCGIRTDGTLACWGSVSESPPLGAFTAVDADSACAVLTNGTVDCWSSELTSPAGTFTDVAGRSGWACGVQTGGSISCWGFSGSGAATPPSGTFDAIGAGTDYACGTRSSLVSCWGNDGLKQAPSSVDLTERTPPETTITSGPEGVTAGNDPGFGFSSNEPYSTFRCSLDDAAFALCSSFSATNYFDLSEGPHTFRVKAVDASGNVDGTAASRAFTVDTVPPDATIDSGPSGLTNDPNPSFGFSATEAGSTFTCSLDGGPFISCASPKSYTDLADGPHTFRVKATDPAGNTDGTAAERSFTVETVRPDTNIDSGPSATTTSTTAAFAFSSDDPTATFECRLDGETFAACTSPKTYNSLSAGSHTFRVRAIDPAGNVDFSPATWNWTIEEPPDTTPPETAIDSGPSGLTASNDPAFTFSSNEVGSTFTCSLDGAAFTHCDSPKSYPDVSDGEHTFRVKATDSAGNTDATAASRTFTVDTTPPETAIDSGPTATTSDTSANFAFSSGDPTATFECRLDDAPSFSACTSPKAYNDLASGAHTFRVRAVDRAGNADGMPAVWNWTVEPPPTDTTPPETTIDSGPAGVAGSSSAAFTFSSNEPASTFQCSLDDDTTFVGCESPRNYTGLADGEHTFLVRATDPAGNTDPTPASRTFTVDTTRPDTNIDVGPTSTTPSTSATFEFSSDEPAATFECRLDDAAPFTACTSPETYTGLGAGPHTFRVRAVDAAGNTDFSPAVWSWTIESVPVDATPPTGAAVSGTVFNKQFSTRTTFSISWSASDPSAPITYDVEFRKARYNRGFGAYETWQSDVTTTTATFTAQPGVTSCFRLTSTDAAANTAAPSAEKCIALPIDDAGLRGSGWQRLTGQTGAYLRTLSQADDKGRRLTLSGAAGNEFALVATKCPGCGTVRVSLGGTLLRKVSLAAASVKKRQVISLGTFTSLRTGTVVIEVTTDGRKIQIDGIGVKRT